MLFRGGCLAVGGNHQRYKKRSLIEDNYFKFTRKVRGRRRQLKRKKKQNYVIKQETIHIHRTYIYKEVQVHCRLEQVELLANPAGDGEKISEPELYNYPLLENTAEESHLRGTGSLDQSRIDGPFPGKCDCPEALGDRTTRPSGMRSMYRGCCWTGQDWTKRKDPITTIPCQFAGQRRLEWRASPLTSVR